LVAESTRIGVTRASRQLGVSRRTAYRWRRRADSFADRSSRPHRSPRRTSDQDVAAILGLRMELRWGPDRLGPYLGLPASTAHAVLRRFGASRLRQLFPVERPVRGTFVVDAPGYIAIDIKSLGSLERGGGRRGPEHHPHNHGRDVGWQHLFVAIDLASRLVYAELRRGRRTADGVAFLAAAVAFFDARGIQVDRVLTDNAFQSTFTAACSALGIRHRRTKPYHPWTNGRAEAFIGTIQRECIYDTRFTADAQRALAIALFVAYYNARRPHTALGGLSPERWLRARGVTQVYGDFS
jgi:transposase InsO family protein